MRYLHNVLEHFINYINIQHKFNMLVFTELFSLFFSLIMIFGNNLNERAFFVEEGNFHLLNEEDSPIGLLQNLLSDEKSNTLNFSYDDYLFPIKTIDEKCYKQSNKLENIDAVDKEPLDENNENLNENAVLDRKSLIDNQINEDLGSDSEFKIDVEFVSNLFLEPLGNESEILDQDSLERIQAIELLNRLILESRIERKVKPVVEQKDIDLDEKQSISKIKLMDDNPE